MALKIWTKMYVFEFGNTVFQCSAYYMVGDLWVFSHISGQHPNRKLFIPWKPYVTRWNVALPPRVLFGDTYLLEYPIADPAVTTAMPVANNALKTLLGLHQHHPLFQHQHSVQSPDVYWKNKHLEAYAWTESDGLWYVHLSCDDVSRLQWSRASV